MAAEKRSMKRAILTTALLLALPAGVAAQSGPELQVVQPRVRDSSPVKGGSFTLSATVINFGDEGSAATTLRYYRSADATISSADTPVGTDSVRALGLSQLRTSSESSAQTAPLTAGTYYYGACVDAVPGESDTTNNCSSSVTVEVLEEATTFPDLAVGSPTVSDSSPVVGGSFTLWATVSNAGDGASAATTLRYYRSTDATISSADMEVGTDAVGALGAGTSSESITLTAPSTAGTYYYGACVDAVTGESDTTDNCSGSVTVEVVDPTTPAAPDLEVAFAEVDDSTPVEGGRFKLWVTVGNFGDADSAATTLRYYQSTDATISSADTQVGTAAVGAVGLHKISQESIDLTAPSTAGTYYYGACVDAVAGESDTTDNCTRRSVTVEVVATTIDSDLVLDRGIRDDSTRELGETFVIFVTVRNQGVEWSPATTVRFYRSTDATITTSDTEVGTKRIAPLRPLAGSGRSITLPAPSTAGTYYYGACVDAVAGELDTTNNCSTSAMRVDVSDPDLTGSFVSVPVEHDGETEFWLELSFDAAVQQGSKSNIRALLGVTGGSETRMRRKDGRLDHWRIRIDPASHEAVTVTLSPSPPCGETGAVCTEDGRTFTTGLATQIQGPASGNNNWSDESVETAVTPVPALPLVGIGLLGLLLALLGSRRGRNDRRQLDASRGR